VLATVLGLQLALVQCDVFGLWPTRPPILRAEITIDPVLHRVHRDPAPAAELAVIADRTCPPESRGAMSIVGIDLVELSGHSLTYAAAKERLAGRAGVCRYDSIGFGTLGSAEAAVRERPYVYWIAVDPDVRPVAAYHAFLNESGPVLFRRLRRRGALQPEPWDGPPGIRLFRFVKR
jgi:hypothetical protein